MKLTTLLKLSLITLSISLTSCSGDKKENADQAETTTSPETTTVSLDPYLLTEAPANPIDIADLRKTATIGDTVTFTGKAIGKHRIFMKDRAIMLLGDPKKITSCDLRPGDNCKTPWDVCCDDRDVINATIVTIQILDNDGKPLKTGIKGLAGIKELSQVIVTGQVAKGTNEKNMLINATGIYPVAE